MTSNEQFAVGNVVTLVSGGPKMTIEEIRGTKAHCVWFVFVGEPQMNWSDPYRDTFEFVLLSRAVLKPKQIRHGWTRKPKEE